MSHIGSYNRSAFVSQYVNMYTDRVSTVCIVKCQTLCVTHCLSIVYRQTLCVTQCLSMVSIGEVGGWGRVPFSRNLMSPTPRRKWYLTTGRRAH